MCRAIIEQWPCSHFRFKEWDVFSCPKADGCLDSRCRDLSPRKILPGTGKCPDTACKGPGPGANTGKAAERQMKALPLPVTQHPPLPEEFWRKGDPGRVSRATIYVGIVVDLEEGGEGDEGEVTARPGDGGEDGPPWG